VLIIIELIFRPTREKVHLHSTCKYISLGCKTR